MKPCEHGYPTPKACLDCMADGNVEPTRPESVKVHHRFTARHGGQCRGCDLPIYEGQSAARLSNGEVMHDGCEPIGATA